MKRNQDPFYAIVLAAVIILLGLAVIGAVTGCASIPEAQTHETIGKDSATVIAVSVDGKPSAFIFVSKTGHTGGVPVDACAASDKCVALVKKLSANDQASVMNLHSECTDSSDDGLPSPGNPADHVPGRSGPL